jgi:hypothetical protein
MTLKTSQVKHNRLFLKKKKQKNFALGGFGNRVAHAPS